MDKAKPTAVLIKAPKADKSRDMVVAHAEPALRIRQSKVTDRHWMKICTACMGEAKLLAKLGLTDKRAKP